MLSLKEEKSSDNLNFLNKGNQGVRRPYRFKTQNFKRSETFKSKLSHINAKYSIGKKSGKKLKYIFKKFSSKTFGSNKNVNKFGDDMINDIIDHTYNFTLNYHLKETAINLLKTGIDFEDKSKIKFFCNYIYQLNPFNKIFYQLSNSKNTKDLYNLQKILFNLSTGLEYEYFDTNKIIFKHGDITDKYYILLKGEVDIIVPNEIEVMMNEYEYFFYILRLYKYQEHSLLKKVLNKNYGIYPLNIKLLEDWIQTAYNTLRHLKKETQINGTITKKKPVHKYIPSYDNAEELFNRLEKQKKINLLMMNKNVIILLEKIRMRNERAREATKNGGVKIKKKDKNKKKKNDKNSNEENQSLKTTIGYSKLDGQLKKIFTNDELIEVIEKCTKEIYQLIEILSDNFDLKKYISELNNCNSETYLNRVEPYFFDEETNKKLESNLFFLSRNPDSPNYIEENNKSSNSESNNKSNIDDIKLKLQNFFGQNKKTKNKKINELFINRRKTIVYHYVLVNTLYSGEAFGEISNESIRKDVINQRIATIITRDNSHLASLKKIQYNKILKEINDNIFHQKLSFLFSLDLFKDCNKNNFMKNYLSFFIKKTYRANETLFNQDDDLGEDRSIFFIVDGSFSSFCNTSINEIEVLFNNLHYDGLIPIDDAHEDNLFNKENHYFNKFKKKKIIFNLFYFTKNDIVGFNDALYDGKYIYTVKCKSSIATVYEIKLKFFNLIVNSEPKLFESVLYHEMVKRNLMIKFFLNDFNNKNNFYKFVSFNDEEENKEEKTIVHKSYFGKNPFRDSNYIINLNAQKKTEFKSIKTLQNKIDNKYLSLINSNKTILSPDMKKADNYATTMQLLNKNNNSVFENKNKCIFRNKSNIKSSILNNSKNNNFRTFRESLTNNQFNSNNDINSKYKNNKKLKKEEKNYFTKNNINENNNDEYEIKIDNYQSKTKNKIVIPPIITNQINKDKLLNNRNKNLYNSLFHSEKKDFNEHNKVKLFINSSKNNSSNLKNDLSFPSTNFLENSSKKITMKSEGKPIKRFKKYLDNIDSNISLKNANMSKNEEIQLKCFLKDIPDFFQKDNCTKNIYFGMNKKKMFQNNALFTDYK